MPPSPTETDTGRVWVDGKTIWSRTINLGAMPNATLKTVPHGIAPPFQVIRVFGAARNATTGFQVPLPFVSGYQAPLQIGVSFTSTVIYLETGFNHSNMTGWVTVEYVKL